MAQSSVPSLQDLLEAGVHFGHQVKRWHPQMAPFIYTARDNIHIIDLLKTREQLLEAAAFLKEQAKGGKVIMFLGTKRQAQEIVREEAERAGMPYLHKRWIGGLITNWDQMKRNLEKLRSYDNDVKSGKLNRFTKKEQLLLRRKMAKLESELSGIKHLTTLPDVLFIIDPKKEDNAVREALIKGIKTVAICDTNTNPQPINYPIAGNDDSLKSVKILVATIASAIAEGKAVADKQAEPKAQAKTEGAVEVAVVSNIEEVLEEVVEEVEGIVKEDQEKEVQNNENTPSEQVSEAKKTESDISEKKQSKEKVVKAKAVKEKKSTTKVPAKKPAVKAKKSDR